MDEGLIEASGALRRWWTRSDSQAGLPASDRQSSVLIVLFLLRLPSRFQLAVNECQPCQGHQLPPRVAATAHQWLRCLCMRKPDVSCHSLGNPLREDYELAIQHAQTAFKSWSKTSPSTRRMIFLRAADIMQSYIDGDATENLSSEVFAVQTNIMATAAIFRETAGLLTHITGEIVPADRPGTTYHSSHEGSGRCDVGNQFMECPGRFLLPIPLGQELCWHPAIHVDAISSRST